MSRLFLLRHAKAGWAEPGMRDFDRPLEPLRTVKVEILEGINAFDSAPVKPWTLTFTVGG